MPLIRKLIDLRTSKAVCLPKSWLENAEQESGQEIVAVALEVDGIITIRPVFNKKADATSLTSKDAPALAAPTPKGGIAIAE